MIFKVWNYGLSVGIASTCGHKFPGVLDSRQLARVGGDKTLATSSSILLPDTEEIGSSVAVMSVHTINQGAEQVAFSDWINDMFIKDPVSPTGKGSDQTLNLIFRMSSTCCRSRQMGQTCTR